ncbi:MAG: AAA family ATPase, partial [Caulobacteraceae bacterium]
ADEQFAKIHRFFRTDAADRLIQDDAAIVPGFQPLAVAKKIQSTFVWARRSEMAAIIAPPGSGKTAAAKQWCTVTPNAWLARLSPSSSRTFAMLQTVGAALNLTVHGGSGHHLATLIRERVANRNGVLIIDEAQEAAPAAMEELRAIHDETGCGLVLMGDRNLLPKLAVLPQFSSRMTWRLELPAPESGDINLLLDAWGVSDKRERAFMAEIAGKTGGGALRALTQTLKLATVMANQQSTTRDLGLLKDCAAQLSTRRGG